MKTVAATRAKNLLGQVLDTACHDVVMLERHGKAQVALMPAAAARVGILCAYASGHFSRSQAMKMLGFSWYGELLDALGAAHVHMDVGVQDADAMAQQLEAIASTTAPGTAAA
jgi:hypothetical protein